MSLSKIACTIGALSMLTACQTLQESPKETMGTVLGAVAGAVIGSKFGGGSGRDAAVVIGAAAGAWFGSSIGKDLDELDKMKIEDTTQDALENNSVGQTSTWSNPDTGNSGTITPTQTVYKQQSPEPCREYSSTVTIDGQLETITGTACRRPDGTWRTVD